MEFSQPDRPGSTSRAALTRISVAGFAFELDGPTTAPRPNARLSEVRLHIGQCVLEGQAVVRSVTAVDGTRREIGCLFHPESNESEERWTALVAGIEAVQGT